MHVYVYIYSFASKLTDGIDFSSQVKNYRKVEAPKRMVELVNHCLANGIMTDRILKAAVRCQVRVLLTYQSSPVPLFYVCINMTMNR